MKKKLIILGVFLGVVLVVVIAGFIMTQADKNIRTGSLSNRAQEYISSKKQTSDTVWRNVDLDNKQANLPRETQIHKDGCFSFTMPFRVYLDRPAEGCGVDISTEEPRAMLTASLKKSDTPTVDELSGVTFRRSKKEVYTEDPILVDGKKYLSFKSIEQGYERTLFYITPKGVFTFALSANTNEDLDPQFKKTIETLKFDK